MDADKRYEKLAEVLEAYKGDEISLYDDLACLRDDEIGEIAARLYYDCLSGS